MIDTKKAREMRAAGTSGDWHADVTPDGPSGQVCRSECVRDANGVLVASRPHYGDVPRLWPRNARLIAHAVNVLVPHCDEIDRLREALRECEERRLHAEEIGMAAARTLKECVGELESAHNFMQANGLYSGGIPRVTAIKVARALLEGGGAS